MNSPITLSWTEAPSDILSAWHELAEQRMPDVHVNRRKEWALARVCLAQCFERHGIKLLPSQTVFKNHHEITHLPAWRFSLSHSKDVAGAWLMPSAQVRGIGMDVELLNRKVPAQVMSRMRNAADAKLGDLDLWALKEAAYKALPTLAQHDIWLNRLIITENKFALENSPFVGEWTLSHENGRVIACAWLNP